MATLTWPMSLRRLLPTALLLTSLGPVSGQVSVAPGGYGPGVPPYGGYRGGNRGGFRGGGNARGGRYRGRNPGFRPNRSAQVRRGKPPPARPLRYVPDGSVNPAPVVGSGGRVYVAAGARAVAAYDRTTGKRLWVFRPGGDVTAAPAAGPHGTVYFTCYDHNVYALDGKTGTKKWQFATGDLLATTPAIGAGGLIYVGGYDHSLYALNSSGVRQWKLSTGGPVTSPTVGPHGTVYVGADRVYAVNGTTGKVEWSFADGYVGNASPLLDPRTGTLYVGAFDGTLYALRARSGHEQWRFTTGTAIVSPPALGADGLLYVGANRLYALTARDGRVRWATGAGGNRWASPVVGADGLVYAGCSDQSVYALSPSGGRVRWTFPVADGLMTAPAPGPQGRVYVARAGSGTLYALDGRTGRPQWHGLAPPTTGG